MSALTPQIKSHRAMAEAFGASAADCGDERNALLLARLGQVHGIVADALEAGERELEDVYRDAAKAKRA